MDTGSENCYHRRPHGMVAERFWSPITVVWLPIIFRSSRSSWWKEWWSVNNRTGRDGVDGPLFRQPERHAWCWWNQSLDASRSGRWRHHPPWRSLSPCLDFYTQAHANTMSQPSSEETSRIYLCDVDCMGYRYPKAPLAVTFEYCMWTTEFDWIHNAAFFLCNLE